MNIMDEFHPLKNVVYVHICHISYEGTLWMNSIIKKWCLMFASITLVMNEHYG